jgi:hypothetical protein
MVATVEPLSRTTVAMAPYETATAQRKLGE